MRPVLFELMGWQVKSYTSAIFLAALVCTSLAIALRPRELLTFNQVLDISLIASIGALIGARGASVLMSAHASMEDVLTVFHFWKRASFSSIGIPVVVIPALLLYFQLKKLPAGRVLDYMIPFALVAVGIQRCLGCFLAGCCYGRPTDSLLGVVMEVAGTPIKVHPTQLYLGIPMFGLALALCHLRWPLPGAKTATASALFCLTNLLVLPYRDDSAASVSLGSKFYLGGLLVSLAGLFFLWKRSQRG